MMDTVAITGADGFMGEKLCPYLSERDYQVRALVRRKGEVADSEYSCDELDDPEFLATVFEGVDCVVHLAARVHMVHENLQDPMAEYRRVNVELTEKLARAAITSGVKRFVFISSITVNGAHDGGNPFIEGRDTNPNRPYAISKLEAEESLKKICAESAMEYVILRPPLIYGAHVRANFLQLVNFINKGIPLPFGMLKNKRSFIGATNFCDLIKICLEHPAAANQLFLAKSGDDLSTAELCRKIGKALNKPARLLPVPAPLLKLAFSLIGKRSILDSICSPMRISDKKTRELLGWTPPLSFEEEMEKFLESYNQI